MLVDKRGCIVDFVVHDQVDIFLAVVFRDVFICELLRHLDCSALLEACGGDL